MVGAAACFGQNTGMLHLFVKPFEQALKTLAPLGHYIGQKDHLLPKPAILKDTEVKLVRMTSVA